MKMTSLKPVEAYLYEVPQSKLIYFSFARQQDDDNVIRLHEWVKCRDFFGDVLLANYYNKKVGIYGLEIDPAIQKINPEKVEMLLRFDSPVDLKSFLDNLHYLNKIEGENNFDYTTCLHVNNSTLLLNADKRWQDNAFMMSLWSYLVKCISYPIPENTDIFKGVEFYKTSNEYLYFKDVEKSIYSVLKYLNLFKIDGVSGWDGEDYPFKINTIHSSSGFVSLIKNRDNWIQNKICTTLSEVLK
jgi:hypothetical protein